MLIALFADIHGNREALTACLADAERAGAERYVFLGDLIGYGADPVWVGHPIGMTGRTSTEPYQAPGIWAATAMASSRSAHSSR